ncbi:MAG: hypothetical protein HYY06_28450 [Deltaproteobacteria bacterium]|nr:hypothetical protein [Deltaproteobacteria bacterium]
MRWTLAIVAASLVCACGGSDSDLTRPPAGEEVACPEDPDAFLGGTETGECPDYWVCTETEDGGKVCTNPGPDMPDGSQEWDCVVQNGETACSGDEMPDAGAGAGWTCVADAAGGVVCTRDQPQFPDGEGSGAWQCEYAELLTCESGDGTSGGFGDDGVGEGSLGSGSSGDLPDEGGSFCFYPNDGAPLPDEPVARAWMSMEVVDGVDVLHGIIAFSTAFVDNTYGANSSSGYRGGRGHTFLDLVRSDHVQVGFLDESGALVLEAKFDYFSDGASTPTGYGNLGVTGADGSVLAGSPDAVVSTMTSQDWNFNELGCVFTESSPGPGECDGWNEQVVYEMWVRRSIFEGGGGFGGLKFDSVHASPSRISEDTVTVEPGDCPP